MAAIKGAHESRMRAIHPYLGWSGDDGSRLWAVLGYGVGAITDAMVVERFGVQRSDSRLLAAGASFLTSRNGSRDCPAASRPAGHED